MITITVQPKGQKFLYTAYSGSEVLETSTRKSGDFTHVVFGTVTDVKTGETDQPGVVSYHSRRDLAEKAQQKLNSLHPGISHFDTAIVEVVPEPQEEPSEPGVEEQEEVAQEATEPVQESEQQEEQVVTYKSERTGGSGPVTLYEFDTVNRVVTYTRGGYQTVRTSTDIANGGTHSGFDGLMQAITTSKWFTRVG